MIHHRYRLIGYNHLRACAVRSTCRFIRTAAHHHHHRPHDSTCNNTPDVFAISGRSSSSGRWFQYVHRPKQQSYHTRVLDCYASTVDENEENEEHDDELLLSIQRKIAQEMSARHFQDALHSVAQLDHLIHQMKARTETKQKENAPHATTTCQEERPTNDESAAKAAEKVRHDTLIQARKITSLSVYIHRQYASNYFLMKQWDDCLEHCDKIFALEREIESLQLSNHLFYDMNVACMIKSQVYQAHQKWDMALKYKNFLIEKRLRPALKVAGENSSSAELMSTDLAFQLQERAKLRLAMGGEEHMILAQQDAIESMNLRPSASGQELLQFLINNTKTSSK